jgi:hypothetical protein
MPLSPLARSILVAVAATIVSSIVMELVRGRSGGCGCTGANPQQPGV